MHFSQKYLLIWALFKKNIKCTVSKDGELLHNLFLSRHLFWVDLCVTTLTVCFNQFLNGKLHLNKMQI